MGGIRVILMNIKSSKIGIEVSQTHKDKYSMMSFICGI